MEAILQTKRHHMWLASYKVQNENFFSIKIQKFGFTLNFYHGISLVLKRQILKVKNIKT